MPKTKLETMSPTHSRWDEFTERLEGEEGCNFRLDAKQMPIWNCKGGNNKDFATKILTTMKNIDIEASLKLFDGFGGHCDCEILFNVENSYQEA